MTNRITRQNVGKGAAYIYIDTIASMVLGYVFWIVMSKLTSTDVIGATAAVVSLSGIFTVVATLGVPTGVQRFLGKSFAENYLADAKVFFETSVIIACLAVVGCSSILLVLSDWLLATFNITINLLIVALFLISSSVTAQLFRSVFISSLKTRIFPFVVLGSSLVKMVLSILLVSIGMGSLGLTIGYTSYQILTSIFLGLAILMTGTFRSREKDSIRHGHAYLHSMREILSSSIVFWIPFLITTIGTQLGPVVVFGFGGSNDAGVYFIALTVVTGLTSMMYSLFTIALPALSAMKDGRKRFTWQTIRLSAIMVLPLSSALIFYSEDILQLLGQDYAEGFLSLQILLLSMLPTTVIYGVHTLVYSYGDYRRVLAIGLATSVPRAVLYLMLVPGYGGTGAAIAYSLGSLLGLAISMVIAREIAMKVVWRELLIITFIPAALTLAFLYLHVNYIAAILSVLIISYLIFFKIHILLRVDIIYLLDVLPSRISQPLLNLLRLLERKKKNFHDDVG